ncbi:MAG: hypothetical protein EA364_13515 [Balneolaceae bacterium]|nr:MAG: hypothetical protein EA364_13515 [Balneolaceae bacterium]
MTGVNKLYKFILVVLVTGVFAMGCDSTDSLSGLEDTLKDIPSLRVIDGADNARIEVNRNNNSSYFTVKLDGIPEDLGLPAGEYDAWCAEWDTPIASNGNIYDGVQVLEITGEEYWKEVVFLLDHAEELLQTGLDTSEGDQISSFININWEHIQLAVWCLINHRKFELNSSYLSQLEERFRNVDIETVELILKYVRQHVSSWEFEKMKKVIYYLKNKGNTQDLIILG